MVAMNVQPRIRVVIADDHGIVREGVRRCLEAAEDIRVIGEAEDGTAAVRLVLELSPDVAVLDISMPFLNGVEALRQIKRDRPRTKVIMLSMHENELFVTQALQAGASGYILKKAAATELAIAVHAVHAGEVYLHPRIVEWMVASYLTNCTPDSLPAAPHDRLSPREREVLQLVAEGLTTPRIAERLVISRKTAEHHRESAMDKLNLRSQTEVVKYAIRTGLVDLNA